jgi:tRNA-(ms[2]io[6]A)-hydroxylase
MPPKHSRTPQVDSSQLNETLPLRSRTTDAWAASALAAPLELLNDHAWLEKKAAANALELLNRWPAPQAPKHWVNVLAGVARDEAVHLSQVVRLLARRGGRLSRAHTNPYANALRNLVRRGQGSLELLDRLLVSALIELRSCERFEALARSAEGQDNELSQLYKSLWTSEMGHYHVFLKLADTVVSPEIVEARWRTMLDFEAKILSEQTPGSRIHSG